ncbi:hypothetical protein ABTK74_20465, partial [Acinetobacter baumannii]
NDPAKFKKAIDEIIKFREEIPQQARSQTDPFINNTLKGLAAKKEAANQQELADYIKGKIK